MYSTTGVSHNKWGYELLGGGLHSVCASVGHIQGLFKYHTCLFFEKLCDMQSLLNFDPVIFVFL